MNIFQQLNKQEETKQRVFKMWDKGKCLNVPPELETLAEVLGQEYHKLGGKVAKIKIDNRKEKRYNSSLKNKPCKKHFIVLPDNFKGKCAVCPKCKCKIIKEN